MKIINFVQLLREIYGKKEPDLEKIEKMGLLAVKIAQHFALRIDFLDESVCRHLMKLYGHASKLDRTVSESLLREVTPDGWEKNFARLDYNPFTAASVGQVHNALLHDGTEVIVKLIKSDYLENFLYDIKRLKRLMKTAIFFYPKLERVFDPVAILDYIAQYTTQELNLVDEYNGQQTLMKLADDNRHRYDFSKLKFHKIYREMTGERYLVSERIKGKTLDDLIVEGKVTYQMILDLFQIHGFYLFAAGTFHGDIHPGNVMVDDDGYFYFIDTGAVSSVSKRMRVGLFRFFESLSQFDYETSAERIQLMATTTISGKKLDSYKVKFMELYKDFAGSTVSEVSLTKKMMETIKLAVHSGMRFEKDMFSIIKSMMYLDGMVLRVNPKAQLMKDMQPFIGAFNKVLSEMDAEENKIDHSQI
ncbi:MAG: AarF/ABC1/UbiB kinase family protein [bacterium]|jgi:ubiquinone biosynthesis protein|nr:AarF/ABC1/UbiB kinase family protein [bacterium]